MADLLKSLVVPPKPDGEAQADNRGVAGHQARGTQDSTEARNPLLHQLIKPKVKMEIQMPTTVHLDVLKSVVSIEDYVNSPPPSSSTTLKKTNAFRSPPVPVAVGTKSSKNTVDLHLEAQRYGLVLPAFTFDMVGEGWAATMEFMGEVIQDQGPFPSKQQAKETLAAQALAMIKLGVENGEIMKPFKAKKVKSAESGGGDAPNPLVKDKAAPNYIGQLLEFQRANSHPQPMYHEYSLGTRFSCTCTLENMPDQIFGSPNEPLFASKKAARYHAAKCAIDFVKSQGLWPDNVTDLGGIKKKKVGQPPTTPNKNTETPNPNPNLPFPGSSVSYTSQVQALAHTLGLNTPEWRFAPEDPQAPGFHTVSAYFKSGGPHEGPVGEVRHIFGKKKAKEECARLTLEYLREVHRQRLALMGVDDAHDDTESSDDFESAPES